MRHIEGVQHRLNSELAPKYVDVVEHSKMRTVDRAKAERLQALKVNFECNCHRNTLHPFRFRFRYYVSV